MESSDNPSQLKERIKELEKVNEQLRESNNKFKSLYELAPLPYQSLDPSGNIIDVNPAWLNTLGYKREEVIGKPFRDFLHKDWQLHFDTNFSEFKKQGFVYNVKFRLKQKKGHYIDVLFEGNAEYETDGSFKQTYCTFKDITQQKKAEINLQKKNEELQQYNQQLEKQEAELTQYKRMVEGSRDMMAAVDREYKYLFVNSAFLKYHQLNEEEVVGNTACEILGEQFFKEKIQPHLIKCFNGKNVQQDIIGQSPEFGQVHLDINYYPLEKDEEIDEVVAVMRDVTQYKQAEKEKLKYSKEFEFTLKGLGCNQVFRYRKNKNDRYVVTFSEGEIAESLGFITKQVKGKTLAEVMGEDEADKLKPYFFRAFEGENVEYDFQFGERWFYTKLLPFETLSDGSVVEIIGISSDITQRKKTEQSLEESERKYRQLFENAPVGISQTALQGQPIMQNDTMAHLLGFENSEEMMNYYYEHGEQFYVDPQRRHECLQKIKDQGYVKNFEYQIRRKDGSHIWLSLTANKLNYQGNEGGVIEGFAIDITKRKEAEFKLQKKYDELEATEEELRASNEELQEINQQLRKQKAELTQYKRMVEGSEDMMVAIDKDYTYLCVNNAFLRYHEIEENEVVGYNISKISGEQDFNEKIKPNIDKCLKGENVHYEIIRQYPELGAVNLEVHYYPLKSEEVTEGIVGVLRDITERKKAEEALKKSEQKFHNLFEQAAIGIFIADARHNIIEANKKALSVLGYSREEMLNMNAKNIIHPDDIKDSPLNENVREMLSGEVLQTERRYCKKDGAYINVLINMGEIDTEENKNLHMVMFQDITERKQAEKELKVKNRISNSFIQSDSLSFYKEIQNIFREAFNSEYGIFGYINDDGDLVAESMTRDIWDECKTEEKSIVFPQDSWGGLWGKSLKERKTLYQNGNLQLPQGHVQLQNAMAAPVVANNKLIGEIALANKKEGYNNEDKKLINRLCDYIAPLMHAAIKQEKYKKDLVESKEKAEESDRLKSAFLANMSHEIRTPMNGIMGFSQMLQEKDFSKEKRDKFLDIIHSRTQHLLQILSDILDIAKIESGQLSTDKQSFYLNDLIKELYDFYKKNIKDKGKTNLDLKIQFNLTREESYLKSDPTRLRQVLDNLLTNAIKFTDDGEVEIGYSKKTKDKLLFWLRDTGVGISSENSGKIFEGFRQVDDASNRLYEGTGLGLTISKNLVELLGGEMWVESEKGKGSIFYFTLPYKSQEIKPGQDIYKQKSVQNWKEKTILIVEDDLTSLEYMKEIIEPTGATTILKESGEEGYQAYKANFSIDLILMDIRLPDISGIEIIKRIRETDKKVKIIAQTAYAMGKDRSIALQAGANDYIAKPIRVDDLLRITSKYI